MIMNPHIEKIMKWSPSDFYDENKDERKNYIISQRLIRQQLNTPPIAIEEQNLDLEVVGAYLNSLGEEN